MREMKDSGIPWIGKIPKNWNLMKIKYTLEERIEKNSPVKTTNILSLTAKQGVIPYGEKEGGGNKPKEDVSEYHLAYPGDIVMNSMNILSGSVGLSKYFGCVSPVYYMLRPKSQNEDVRFYNYIFQTEVFQKSLFGLGNGILIKESANGKFNTIRMRIPMDKFRKLYLPVASLSEQHRIADFLDTKCARIDSIKKNVEAEIEALKQYKKSVITEAVTKGLDKNVEMKDSGIPWIGEIPKDWQITRIKYTCNSRSEKALFNHKYNKYLGLENVVGFSNEIIDTNSSYADGYYDIYKYGDVLFSKLRPYLGKVLIATQDGFCTGEFIRLFNYHGDRRFLRYWMMNNQFINEVNNSTYGAKMPRANPEFIMNMPIPALLYKIQHRIADYLDTKCARIDSIIQKKQELLTNLDTYKKSLIYEYVTGKKEVPAV